MKGELKRGTLRKRNKNKLEKNLSNKIQKLLRKRKQHKSSTSSRGRMKKLNAYNPLVPFPQRLQKANLEEQFFRFLNMFKKIEISIPFSKSLTQMPQYAKFMKDILSKKRKIIEEGIVSLIATCSVVIQKTLQEKM